MDNGDGDSPPGPVGQNDEQASDLNISDVFEAISIADPWFGAGASVDATMPRQPAVSGAAPFMRITEQPASKSLRFRYECEGRSAGSIPGVNSTPENRTYPTLKVFNYVGRAVIVVSCVTKDEPYRPHPHNLVGRERCDKGVCTIKTEITEDGFEYQFKNLGIQCIRRRDVPAALRVREDLRVDPYRTGYSHRNQPQSIDLNAVRLCFQVFLQNESGKVWQSLPPVVSDVIFDKKAMSDLLITRASHCSGTTRGGTQLILLCEKVTREDTAVVFYQEENNQVVWEETAIIAHVHKQVAIVFQTPPYRNPHTTEHVNVMFQLKRLTDNIRSNSLPYEYIPDFQDSDYLRGKRRKTLIPSMLHTTFEQDRSFQVDPMSIKAEPKDKTPPHQNVASPPLHVYPPHYAEQDWGMHMEMQPGLVPPGPNQLNPFVQNMPWQGTSYGQPISPNLQTLSPNVQALSPIGQALSPNVQALSPAHAQAMSPIHAQALSPNAQVLSPMGQAMSPMGQARSPMDQAMSPMHGGVSPNHMGHISPNLVQQANYAQMPQQVTMETSQSYNPSLSTLLMERGEGQNITFNSTELSGLSSLLGNNNPDLSDSLNRLSTSELQNYLN